MITNQPKSSQIDKRTQDKAKVSLLYLHYISLLSRLTNFFSIFCFPYKSLQNREKSCLPAVPLLSYSFTRNRQRRFVPLSFPCTSICSVHSGAFVAYSGVTLVSFLFVAVSFQIVPVYSGIILVHSVSFRRHSGLLRYIPVPFLSIPFHSAVFRYVPVYSVPFDPFLCLVTPVSLIVLLSSIFLAVHCRI